MSESLQDCHKQYRNGSRILPMVLQDDWSSTDHLMVQAFKPESRKANSAPPAFIVTYIDDGDRDLLGNICDETS